MRVHLRFVSIWSVAIVLFSAATLPAEVKLHRLFSDNGILQRDIKVPVWGTTDNVEPVTVDFAEQTQTATPVGGKWRVEFSPLSANSTGRELVVKQGDQTISRKNIVVGDVWLCGGQSNMDWKLSNSVGHEAAIKTAANPNLRLFTVPRPKPQSERQKRRGVPTPQTDLASGEWQEASPETVGEFSAVGFFFGRALQKAVNVPVGLINSNVGGTTAERWMDIAAIESNPEIRDMHANQGKADLYNSMIAPLATFAVKGAIWYQGESNAGRPYHYRHVLTAMIKNWRDTFGCGDFPFLMVELAPFKEIAKQPVDEEWAVVRDSLQWVAKKVPNTATVSIVDVGEVKDIHPKQKQPVGERLAIAARAMVYGEKITPAGPQFESLQIDGNKAIVRFKNVGGGLEAKEGELTGFTLAGDDKKFHLANAKIEGDAVVVTSDEVPAPKAVRFGWANFPVVNLWNKDGLPAHPFRTDDWEVVKQHAK
jgi:sialate O-acetylesterase